MLSTKQKAAVIAAGVALTVGVGVVGATAGSGGGSPRAVAKPSPSPSSYSTSQVNAIAARAQARQAARYARQEARREARQAARLANAPRHIQYLIRGSTSSASITYTATGGGTSQRTIQVLPEWRAVEAKLRPGDFAYISAQNEQDYGSIECRIIELTPYGQRRIGHATTSSGAYAITDCSADVP